MTSSSRHNTNCIECRTKKNEWKFKLLLLLLPIYFLGGILFVRCNGRRIVHRLVVCNMWRRNAIKWSINKRIMYITRNTRHFIKQQKSVVNWSKRLTRVKSYPIVCTKTTTERETESERENARARELYGIHGVCASRDNFWFTTRRQNAVRARLRYIQIHISAIRERDTWISHTHTHMLCACKVYIQAYSWI